MYLITHRVIMCALMLFNNTWGWSRPIKTCWSYDWLCIKSVVLTLTFMGPCITNVFSSATNKMQRYTAEKLP